MDEWELAFSSIAAAENGRAAIEDQLAFLELELNPMKVEIIEGPVPLNPSWYTRLRSVPFDAQNTKERDIVTLYDTAFELSRRHRTKEVINWALSRTMSCTINGRAWRSLEPLLLQAAASEPGTLGRSLRLICIAQAQGHAPHPVRIAETLYEIILQAARRSQWSEVAWAIWGHILLRIPLDPAEARAVALTDDPVVALCALDALSKGLVSQSAMSMAIQRWVPLVTGAALNSRDWLLTYEAVVKNWLPTPTNVLQTDYHYSTMAKAGVYFYRDNVDPTFLMMNHKGTAPPWMTHDLQYLI